MPYSRQQCTENRLQEQHDSQPSVLQPPARFKLLVPCIARTRAVPEHGNERRIRDYSRNRTGLVSRIMCAYRYIVNTRGDVMGDTAALVDTNNKMKLALLILTGLLAIGAAIGGTWYVMKNQVEEAEAISGIKQKPATFIKLETFTVNLQPENDERNYLQVDLAIKAYESQVVDLIMQRMPEIRNQIILLLSSKKPSEIYHLEGKQHLSQHIAEAIKLKIESEVLQEDIADILFTSFIIQ